MVTGPNVSAALGGEACPWLDEVALRRVQVLERLRWCRQSCARLEFVAELDDVASSHPETVDARGLSAALLAVASRQAGRRTMPSWSPSSEKTVRRPALDETRRSEPAYRCGEGGSVVHER